MEHKDGLKLVTLPWIIAQMRADQRTVEWSLVEPDEMGAKTIEVRLQLVDGDAVMHAGEACYDTDHRGYWGHAYITEDSGYEELLGQASYLLRQVEDAVAEDC